MIVGIDPGLTGAIAIVDTVSKVIDMPVVDKRINVPALLDIMGQVLPSTPIYIEPQQPMAKQGLSSTAKTMLNYGLILGALIGDGFKVVEVPPNRWKGAAGLRKPNGWNGRNWPIAAKEKARERALRLYPGLSDRLARKKDHNRAEALLIATYGPECSPR